MTRSFLLKTLIALVVTAGLLFAQTANPKSPQPKSQKEIPALQAMFNAYQAQDADGTIKAAMELVTQFADTDFKSTAFMMAAESARQKGDQDNAVVYAEKCLEADPKYYAAQILIAQVLAQRTREFDLDREEKLGRADKFANQAIELIKSSTKLQPQLTDEQFESIKKNYSSQAYEALGMTAMVRKKYDACVEQLKMSVDMTPAADPATMVRLGNCYRMTKKYDEATAILDKAIADPNANPRVKEAATAEKIAVNKDKAATAK